MKKYVQEKQGKKEKTLKKRTGVPKKTKINLTIIAQKLKGNSTVKHYEDGALNTKKKKRVKEFIEY